MERRFYLFEKSPAFEHDLIGYERKQVIQLVRGIEEEAKIALNAFRALVNYFDTKK